LKGMGKVGKTFTVDVKVLVWLEEYAIRQHKKQSLIVNDLLYELKRQTETWNCPKCNATVDNQFTKCHSCEYILDFKDIVKA